MDMLEPTDLDPMAQMKARLDELDAKVGALMGPHAQHVLMSLDPTGQEVEGEHTEFVLSEGPPPGVSVAEWVSGLNGSPGIVVDPGIARSTPCLALELGDGYKPLVYSKGIVGALDEDQVDLYCQEGLETREASPKQRARLEALREASHECHIEAEPEKEHGSQAHLEAYFACLGKELRTRGIEP